MTNHAIGPSELFESLRGVGRRHGRLIGVFALGATLGCGAPVDGSEQQLTSRSGALQDPHDPTNPIMPLAASQWSTMDSTGYPSGDPILLAEASHLLVAFQLSGLNGYWGAAGDGPTSAAWGLYSDDAFSTPPATARLPVVGSSDYRLIVVGRGRDDHRIFWSEASTRPTQGIFSAPEPVTAPAFAPINGNTFNDPYGYPAMTAANNGDVVMVYMGPNSSNKATLYSHRKPYHSAWKARVAAPALPSGWSMVGVPAITWGYQSQGTVVLKATNGSQTGLFRIFTTGDAFLPAGAPAFTQLTLPTGSAPAESNPAVEWDPDLNTHTLYYRSGGSLYEASFLTSTFYEAPKLLQASTNPYFVGTPSVAGGTNLENTEHWILARDNHANLRFNFTYLDSDLQP
ncbi:MAG TPA: hypothetical protein VN962_18445 [Polyangia bacterium]|nr:hypothetical protein [Polyangia bacterium]